MFDEELQAIAEELEKEKTSQWPEVPPIQARSEELHRRIQDLKRAIYDGEVTVIMAKEQLPSVIRAGLQLKRIEGELAELVSRRPLLRRSLQLLRLALRELDEIGKDLRAYIDLHSCEDSVLQDLGAQWSRAKGKAERRLMRERIRDRVHALIEEGCRCSQQEDSALAEASQRLALEALSSDEA